MRAIRNSEWDFPGIATKFGLTMRTILDKTTPGSVFRFDNDLNGSKLMMQFVLSDPEYSQLFVKYDINPMEYLL